MTILFTSIKTKLMILARCSNLAPVLILLQILCEFEFVLFFTKAFRISYFFSPSFFIFRKTEARLFKNAPFVPTLIVIIGI